MSAQTCPRRMTEIGPWARKENQDVWSERYGKLRCSFCGSLNPNDVISRLAAGEEATPTDKNYKLYVGASHDKAYFHHFDESHMGAFISLYNASIDNVEGLPSMKVGYPGHFYSPPFFMQMGRA